MFDLNEGNPYVQTQIKHLESRTLRQRVTSKMKPPARAGRVACGPLRGCAPLSASPHPPGPDGRKRSEWRREA